jgi:hypothetical protein
MIGRLPRGSKKQSTDSLSAPAKRGRGTARQFAKRESGGGGGAGGEATRNHSRLRFNFLRREFSTTATKRRLRGPLHHPAAQDGPPCMLAKPNRHKLRGASRPVAAGPDADGWDRNSPWVFGTAGEHGPSVLRLLSSTDDREHVPHARQGSVRTRDQGSL